MRVAYGFTLIMSLLAMVVFVVGVAGASGAPQEASAAAIAIGLAVIPYVLSRCLEKLKTADQVSTIIPVRAEDRIQPSAEATVAATDYFILVGSKESRDEAMVASADIQRNYCSLIAGYRIQVQQADLGSKGVWYRLRVGPITDQTIAINLCRQLKSQGLPDCRVITR